MQYSIMDMNVRVSYILSTVWKIESVLSIISNAICVALWFEVIYNSNDDCKYVFFIL